MTAQIYLTVVVVASVVSIVFSLCISHQMVREYVDVEEVKLDVNEKQMWESEKRIAEFFWQYRLRPDVSTIWDVGRALKIIESPETDESIQEKARLSEKDADGFRTVVYRPGLTKEEQTFTFAHECGHIVNDDPTPATRPDGYGKPEAEQLADYTGGALLMPLESVYKYLVEFDYAGSGRLKKTSMIYTLCEKYGVDRMTALRRVKEVCILKGIA